MVKKIVFLVLMMLSPVLAGAQKVIQMEKEGGVYKIACKVNGARMKMIFDTGASSVSLSMSIANYLYDNDYITKEDILGKGKSQTADGSIVDHIVINLRDIEIDGLHLKNVEATVIDGQDAPLLLGQSAIQKLGPVTISGNNLIINNASNHSISNEEVEELRKKANLYYGEGSYYAVIELYTILRKNLRLNSKDYSYYIASYLNVGQYKKVIELVSEWENGPEYIKADEITKIDIYVCAGNASLKFEDYNSWIIFVEKWFASKQLAGEKFTGKDYKVYAQANQKVGRYDIARNSFIKSLKQTLSDNNCYIKDIYNGTISYASVKEEIGFCLAEYAGLYDKLHNNQPTKEGFYLWIGAAKCGDEMAIKHCNTRQINYKAVKYNPKYDNLFIAR